MANNNWSDDYWLLLAQVFLRKPAGIKPTYCRDMVGLALELHIAPEALATRMRLMADVPTPRIERMLNTYRDNPARLSRLVKRLRGMKGFNNAAEFYDGVETTETFERLFKPVADDTELTPLMLTLVLQLYFLLTPITMVAETPEVVQLAKLLKQKPQTIANALIVYQHCDPYLNRKDTTSSTLFPACKQLWNKYASTAPKLLDSDVEKFSEYFK